MLCGTSWGKTYAYSITMLPTIAANDTECQKTNRKILPSEPTWFVAAVRITQGTGGSLADVLDTLATTLQERKTKS